MTQARSEAIAAHEGRREHRAQLNRPPLRHAATDRYPSDPLMYGPIPKRQRDRSGSTALTNDGTKSTPALAFRPLTSSHDAVPSTLRERRYRHQSPLFHPNQAFDQNLRSSSHSSYRQSPLTQHNGDIDEDSVRTSFRSALTTTSSFFSPSTGTERSSFMTDASSASQTPGIATDASDNDMSVDDAIGMYASGFSDDVSKGHLSSQNPAAPPLQPHPAAESAEVVGRSLDNESRPKTAPTLGRSSGPPDPPHLKSRQQAQPQPASPRPQEPHDYYGFKIVSQHVSLSDYNDWCTTYEHMVTRRRKKWVALLKDSGLQSENPDSFPPRSAKVKRFVRKGIPPEWRGAAWFWYAGGYARWRRYPDLYKQLRAKVDSGKLCENDRELIERDLHRTFPDNVRFRPPTSSGTGNTAGGGTAGKRYSTAASLDFPETEILQSLRRVLQAFSVHNPKIGYCQSLNFIVGMLLLFLDEEKAFWMLHIITNVYLPGTHEVNLEGANVDLAVLMMSIKESMPGIYAKIGGELDGTGVSAQANHPPTRLPPITLCTTAWFMSCFIGTLPVESVLRVWDSFFYEGSKTLFRIAITIFKVGEHKIRAVGDPMEMFQVVQTIPRSLIDANALLEACFKRRNGFGHLSQNTVDARRRGFRELYAKERARKSVSKASGQPRTSSSNDIYETNNYDAYEEEDGVGRGNKGFNSNSLRQKLRKVESRGRLKMHLL